MDENYEMDELNDKCCICHSQCSYPMSFSCSRHIACALCILKLYQSSVSNIDEKHPIVLCPVCRVPSGKLSFNAPFNGVLPIPDVFIDKVYKNNIYPCLFCDYKGTMKETCNHMITNCTKITFDCFQCGHKIKASEYSYHINMICSMSRCMYCGKIGIREHIKKHEKIHEYFKHLSFQFHILAYQSSNIEVSLNPINMLQRKSLINKILKYNRKKMNRLMVYRGTIQN